MSDLKKRKNIFLTLFALILTFFILLFFLLVLLPSLKTNWAFSTAEIISVEEVERGHYLYMFKYQTPESAAINQAGEKITGPIEQLALVDQKPLCPQKVRLKYNKNEPIIFKFLKPLKFAASEN